MATPFQDIPYRMSLLLPSGMDVHEFEAKIFQHQKPTVAEILKPETYDDVLYLFSKHHRVIGAMFMCRDGRMISTTVDPSIGGMYCGIVKQILDIFIPAVESADATSPSINILRICSTSQEVVIAPIPGEDLFVVVVQDLKDSPSIAKSTKGAAPSENDSRESDILKDRTVDSLSNVGPSTRKSKIDFKMGAFTK